MRLIAHRRNTTADLIATDRKYGVEVDIRSERDSLILTHDPFTGGEEFASWLRSFAHGTLILNVKEDALEERIMELLKSRGIEDFFFLDQPFPALIKWSNSGERRCAVRISEFETIETALRVAGRVDWVWVDCFTRFPLSAENARLLRRAGFKLCVVSPELQGRSPEVEISKLAALLRDLDVQPDAVCTKRPDLWEAGSESR